MSRINSSTLRLLATLGVLTAMLATAAIAQDKTAENDTRPANKTGPQPGDNPESEKPNEENDSVLSMVLDSGVTGIGFMVVLVLFSIVAGTVAVERAFKMGRERILPPDVLAALQRAAAEQDATADSLRAAYQDSDSTLAVVMDAGIQRFGAALSDVEKAFEDAAAREMAEIRARIRPLSTIGSIAPLVGLLGTVVGMIVAFHTASQTGLGKAELLAKGIYMALLTTAGGLSVAIPCLMLAAKFNGKAEGLFREMDRALMDVLPVVHGGSAAPTPKRNLTTTKSPVTPAPTRSVTSSPPTPTEPTVDKNTEKKPAPAPTSPAAATPVTEKEAGRPASSRAKRNPLMPS